MSFDLKYFERFEKQIILKKVGISGQKKILKSKVLIIGVGGLGCLPTFKNSVEYAKKIGL